MSVRSIIFVGQSWAFERYQWTDSGEGTTGPERPIQQQKLTLSSVPIVTQNNRSYGPHKSTCVALINALISPVLGCGDAQ